MFQITAIDQAEQLLDLARHIRLPRGRSWYVDSSLTPPPTEGDFALIKTALDFEKKDPAFIFRAIYENWDLIRLNKEMY